MSDKNVQREPVSRVGAVLFILTMLFIAALIGLAGMFLFSLGDIVRGAVGFVQGLIGGLYC